MVCDGGDFRWIYLSLKAKLVKDRCIKLASINPTCPSFCKIQNRPTGKKTHQTQDVIRCLVAFLEYTWVVATIRPCFTCKKKRYFDLQICWRNRQLTKPSRWTVWTVPRRPAGSLGRRCRPAGRHLVKGGRFGAQGFATMKNVVTSNIQFRLNPYIST